MRISTRLFSEEANGIEERTEDAPAEEIAQPLAHNKFAHVIICSNWFIIVQPGALVFEHTKDNEPGAVGDDDLFAVVQLSGTQYKLGKV